MRVMNNETRYNHIITSLPMFTRRYFRVKPCYVYTEQQRMEELGNACAICIQRFYRRNKLIHAMFYVKNIDQVNVNTCKKQIRSACKRLVHMCFVLNPGVRRTMYLNWYAEGSYLAFYMYRNPETFARVGGGVVSQMLLQSRSVRERLSQVHDWVMGRILRRETRLADISACLGELDAGILELKRLYSVIRELSAAKISRTWRENRVQGKIKHIVLALNCLSDREISQKQLNFIWSSSLPRLFSSFIQVIASLVKRLHPIQAPFDINEQIHGAQDKRGCGLLYAILFERNYGRFVPRALQRASLFDMNRNAKNFVTVLRQLLELIQSSRETAIDTLIQNLPTCMVFLACEDTFNLHLSGLQGDFLKHRGVQIEESVELHRAFQSLNLGWIAMHGRPRINIQESLSLLRRATRDHGVTVERNTFSIHALFHQDNVQYPSDHNLSQSMSFDQDLLQQLVKTLNLPDTAWYFLYSSQDKQFTEQAQIRHGGCTFYANMHNAIEEVYWKHLKQDVDTPDPKLHMLFSTLKHTAPLFNLSSSYTEITEILFEKFDTPGCRYFQDPAMNKDIVAGAIQLTDAIANIVSSTLDQGNAAQLPLRRMNNAAPVPRRPRCQNAFENRYRAIKNRFNSRGRADGAPAVLYYTARLIYKTCQAIHLNDVNSFLRKYLANKQREFNALIRGSFRAIYSKPDNVPKLFNSIRHLQQILQLPQVLEESNCWQLILCLIINSAQGAFFKQEMQELPETLRFEMDCVWRAATCLLYSSFLLQFVRDIQVQISRHDPREGFDHVFFLETRLTKVLLDFNPSDVQSGLWESSILFELNSRLAREGNDFRFSPTSAAVPKEIEQTVSSVYAELTLNGDNARNFPVGNLPQQILRLRAGKDVQGLKLGISVHKEVFLEAYIQLYSHCKRMEL